MPLPPNKIDFAGISASSLVVKSSGFYIYDIDSVCYTEILNSCGNIQDIFGPTSRPFYALSVQNNTKSGGVGEPIFILSSSRTNFDILSEGSEDGEFDENEMSD